MFLKNLPSAATYHCCQSVVVCRVGLVVLLPLEYEYRPFYTIVCHGSHQLIRPLAVVVVVVITNQVVLFKTKPPLMDKMPLFLIQHEGS